MKNVLIVHAHPEQNSFCAALKHLAVKHFENKGYSVEVSDLYAMGFNPVGDQSDFKALKNPDYFKYQAEQVHAYEHDLFKDYLNEEMEKLEKCDILIFNFPLWWFGLPAILKGWVDRVFAMGFVYGNGKGVYDNGIYPNKRAFLSLTTGGPDIAYNGGKNGDIMQILYPINHGMLYFCGMTVLEPFICYGPVRKSDEERAEELKRYEQHLNQLDELEVLYAVPRQG